MTLSTRNVLRHAGRLSRCLIRHAGRPRHITVVAIETSCDDTAVAVVKDDSIRNGDWESEHLDGLRVIFHERITANNDAYTGIHPLAALHSHRSNLALLLKQAISKLEDSKSPQSIAADGTRLTNFVPPDLVVVTRGPGMRSNLSVGLDTAKGLAVAWNRPLIGVHHMQAHALTPRLIDAMTQDRIGCGKTASLQPSFPFLTVLASGGHTMLIDSIGLTDHSMLAETQDIALGNLIDHVAKVILPPNLLISPFGRALENFAFEDYSRTIKDPPYDCLESGSEREDSQDRPIRNSSPSYDYIAPARRQEELERRATAWGWTLAPPLAEGKGGRTSKRMIYSFAGLLSSVERFIKFKFGPDGRLSTELRNTDEISLAERKDMAREVQRVAFEHLASRILLHLGSVGAEWKGDTIVISGGVASNKFLRHVLRSMLDARGYSYVKLSFPPVELCTDNALMIAWAGIEMYRAGYTSDLSIGPLRKWSMDPAAPDGGILGVEGWIKNE